MKDKLKFTLKAWPVIAVAAIGLSYITWGVAKLFGIDLPEQLQVEAVRGLFTHAFDSALAFSMLCIGLLQALVIMPAFEEFLFRWLLVMMPARHFRIVARMSALPAIVFSSALFSFMHYIDYVALAHGHGFALTGWNAGFISIFFIGLAQCWLYRKTDRIWCPMLNHALFNLTTIVLMLVIGSMPSAANAADANGVKLKVTGVAVADSTEEGKKGVGAKILPPETHVVVGEGQVALFRVEYEMPEGLSGELYLKANYDYSGSKVIFNEGFWGRSCSGKGSVMAHISRDVELEKRKHFNKNVLLKSVRVFGMLNGRGDTTNFSYADIPINVVFTKRGVPEEDVPEVLEALPPVPPASTSLLPGWTEDFKSAYAQAAKDKKLILAYLLDSGKGSSGVLDHKVLGSSEFLEKVGKSYVLCMCEAHPPCQSWNAMFMFGKCLTAEGYSDRSGKFKSFAAPEMLILRPGDKLPAFCLARMDKDGWDGGVDGYLAKIEDARRDGLAKLEADEKAREAEKKARAEAVKKVPPKTDSTSTPAGFTDNLDEALAKAKADGKLVYACFSGSDWCGWCQKLEKEVLSDPVFVASVMDDYVLVYIDSPRNKALLSDHAKAENEKLTEKYGIRGFPTALILDGDGKKVDKTGYRKGGAAKYAKHLMEIKKGLKK